MRQRWLSALLSILCAAASLFTGLAPTLLDYGRFELLDWLLPGFVALAVLRLASRPGLKLAVLQWALVALPPMLVVGLAGTVLPWRHGLVVALLLGGIALSLDPVTRWRSARRWAVLPIGLFALAIVRYWALPQAVGPAVPPVGRVAVMTALPLFQQNEGASDPLHGVGARAPIIRALDATWKTVPIDLLDANSLRPVDHLLLIQPRLLAPAELVALDDWVRSGGNATILADPLLRWPGERSLGDPRRAPLTSLLDPLMRHWGLTLEPAQVGSVERRVLTGGAMIQLASASRFAPAKAAPCLLTERGLIAYCSIGRGKAVLVADADWIDDRLWTLSPDQARDQRAWTSDSVPLLARLISGDRAALHPGEAWMVSQEALISGLRWALGLIVLASLALARFGPNPIPSQVRQRDLPLREKERSRPPPDSA